MAKNTERDLRLFRELIACTNSLSYWTVNPSGSVTFTTCPDAKYIGFFLTIVIQDILKAFSEDEALISPYILTSDPGLYWIADCERDINNSLILFHIIGPVFSETYSANPLAEALSDHGFSDDTFNAIYHATDNLPILSLIHFMEYGIMLHYCITNEKISVGDFTFLGTNIATIPSSATADSSNGLWETEQQLLKTIEEGNMEYKKRSARSFINGIMDNIQTEESIRSKKNNSIVFAALSSRVAIRGGLTPEIGYSLCRKYISQIEACTSPHELILINDAMQEDFVERVHRFRINAISPQIQNCCQYIQTHIDEKLYSAAIAKHVGYSETYLTKKFKS